MGLFDDLVRLGDQVRVFDDFALLGFLKPRILKCPTVAGVDQGRKSSTAGTYGPALLARPDVAQSRFGRGFPRGWAPPEQIAQALRPALPDLGGFGRR